MRKRRKESNPEDEIVVANMNVEGMPWYDEHAPGGKKYTGKLPDRQDIPSWKETWLIIGGAMKAGLLISLVFAATLILFTLFCVFVWGR